MADLNKHLDRARRNLEKNKLREAVADHNHDYCYACYTGNYPTELVNINELLTSSKDRRG